jgi:biopolymer transport protein ExbD
MTPMVDIAFLLLIFYMVSTVFSMPQAMEITLPPDDEVPIQAEDLLTIRVDADGGYWWNKGEIKEDNMPRVLSASEDGDKASDSLRTLLVDRYRQNPRLAVLVLLHPEADYLQMVNILDEFDLIERSWNSFAAERMGVKIGELPTGKKFSIRYAIGDWKATDDKVIEHAVDAAMERGEL